MQTNSNFSMPLTQRVNSFIKRSPARMAVIIAALLYAFTIMMVPEALNVRAISTIAMLTILLSFASAGQTIVLIGGGLDMSVGAVMSAAAILTTSIMNGQDGMFIPSFVVVISMGAVVGFVNGICTTKIGLPALIVTMVISNIVARLQFVFTAGSPFGFAGPRFIQSVISRPLPPPFSEVPALALYALVIFPLVFYILNRSRFGRQLYLVGSNSNAAKLSGINVNKIKILSYVISGMFAGFAGMLGAGFMQSAQVQMFDEYAFNSLIAVIVGGTTFAGGVGNYSGSIAGALMMVVLSNMLSALQLSQPIRNIMLGAVLILLLTLYNRKKPVRL